jgi:hypothetical protein
MHVGFEANAIRGISSLRNGAVSRDAERVRQSLGFRERTGTLSDVVRVASTALELWHLEHPEETTALDATAWRSELNAGFNDACFSTMVAELYQFNVASSKATRPPTPTPTEPTDTIDGAFSLNPITTAKEMFQEVIDNPRLRDFQWPARNSLLFDDHYEYKWFANVILAYALSHYVFDVHPTLSVLMAIMQAQNREYIEGDAFIPSVYDSKDPAITEDSLSTECVRLGTIAIYPSAMTLFQRLVDATIPLENKTNTLTRWKTTQGIRQNMEALGYRVWPEVTGVSTGLFVTSVTLMAWAAMPDVREVAWFVRGSVAATFIALKIATSTTVTDSVETLTSPESRRTL